MAVEFDLTRTFTAPPDAVFDAHTDLDKLQEWMHGCERIEKITDGPVGVGTIYRETRLMGKHRANEQFEITAMERPQRLSLYTDGAKGSTGRGEYFFDYVFEKAPADGTTVHLHGKIDMGGFFFNLFAKLMKGIFIKGIKIDFDALAKYLASNQDEA